MSDRPRREGTVITGRQMHLRRAFGATVVVACALLFATACQSVAPARTSPTPTAERVHADSDHPYVGMWVTADGQIRQELLPSGRYDEARGECESAYTGRYDVRGNHIDYWDDTGFTADGTFVTGNELRHGGMTFYRQPR